MVTQTISASPPKRAAESTEPSEGYKKQPPTQRKSNTTNTKRPVQSSQERRIGVPRPATSTAPMWRPVSCVVTYYITVGPWPGCGDTCSRPAAPPTLFSNHFGASQQTFTPRVKVCLAMIGWTLKKRRKKQKAAVWPQRLTHTVRLNPPKHRVRPWPRLV